MKKELIKNVIKPFFKKNGFSNKGINFYKDVEHFHLKVWLQSQRYYKEEGKEKFRLNFEAYIPEFNEKVWERSFAENFIGEEDGGWVVLTSSTYYADISDWLNQKLKEKLADIIERMQVNNLLLSFEDSSFFDERYPFLLKKYQPKKYPMWLEAAKQELENLRLQIKALASQQEEQYKREKSLDRDLKLTGINMQLVKLEWREERTEKVINFMENLILA